MSLPSRLPLAVVGCDFRVASTSWRAALVLAPEERADLHGRLTAAAGARGLAALETCNRTEWIAEADEAAWAAELLRGWMLRRWRDRMGPAEVPVPYVLVGDAAARHFLRIAVGLESFVPGEREIVGQCHRALADARGQRTGSSLLDALGSGAARAVRRVDRLCRFRDPARGVHQLAADALAENALVPGRPGRVGIVGMGAVGRRVAALLASRGAAPVAAFNRTIPPEQAGRWRALAELGSALADLDALIVSTGARAPIIDLPALVADRRRPLTVVDLGHVPQVRGAEGLRGSVEVLGLDDLLRRQVRAIDPRERETAEGCVEAALGDLLTAWRKRRSAELLAAAQLSRRRTQDERLPGVLDKHLDDLEPARRRRLETELRGLVRDQHRDFLREVGRDRGAAPGGVAAEREKQGDAGEAGPGRALP